MSVIIPALNEEASIAGVVGEMPWPLLRECIVVDNGSTDNTAAQARAAGAGVVWEPRRGYGQACATGAASAVSSSDVLVFLDGDGSDVPAEIALLAAPVLAGAYDFVIASRLRGAREPGSLLVSQVFAGWLAGMAMRLLYGVRYTDMGPMRAITRSALERMRMQEMTYGWNLEMQMKAASAGLRILEVPTTCRCRRGGVSKVAGSLQGSVKAAYRITEVLLRIALTGGRSQVPPAR
ncbi:glycosyltransferase family 2 protein [Acidipila sp. EB88]|nr:glycosyltransferase family 2 protein [Acidipila sp. EB88]